MEMATTVVIGMGLIVLITILSVIAISIASKYMKD